MVPESCTELAKAWLLRAERSVRGARARAVTERDCGATWLRKISERARDGAASSAACERSERPTGEQVKEATKRDG